jgi:hypothetical protein
VEKEPAAEQAGKVWGVRVLKRKIATIAAIGAAAVPTREKSIR